MHNNIWIFYFIIYKRVRTFNLYNTILEGVKMQKTFFWKEYTNIWDIAMKFKAKEGRLPNYTDYNGFRITKEALSDAWNRVKKFQDSVHRNPATVDIEVTEIRQKPAENPNNVKLLVYPTENFKANSLGYGAVWPPNTKKLHCGIDVNRDDTGAKVRAIKEGIVKHVNTMKEWDSVVCIEHTSTEGNKYTSVYWHIEQVKVSKGQQVATGQQIGVIGKNNGYVNYHDHLHFGIRYAPFDSVMSLKGALDKKQYPLINGKIEKFINPLEFLKKYA